MPEEFTTSEVSAAIERSEGAPPEERRNQLWQHIAQRLPPEATPTRWESTHVLEADDGRPLESAVAEARTAIEDELVDAQHLVIVEMEPEDAELCGFEAVSDEGRVVVGVSYETPD